MWMLVMLTSVDEYVLLEIVLRYLNLLGFLLSDHSCQRVEFAARWSRFSLFRILQLSTYH